MKAFSFLKSPRLSLLVNFAYAVGNCTVGFVTNSRWFVILGAYYAVLAIARFSVLQVQRKADGDLMLEAFAKKVTGYLLVALSFCLIGIITLSAIKDRGTNFHKILMITIATYTFTKIVLAIIGVVKAKKILSPVIKTLRDISLADAFVSIYSMQRSMLVSFPGMTATEIRLFNILTGTAVWLILLLLGINLIGGRYVNMAKSKIVEANKKIANAVAGGYKVIEKGVVDGYKKIQDGVVDGYSKMEDKFVEAYLTKDGETVAEAKARLKNKTNSK